jgi:hypothetical protein
LDWSLVVSIKAREVRTIMRRQGNKGRWKKEKRGNIYSAIWQVDGAHRTDTLTKLKL